MHMGHIYSITSEDCLRRNRELSTVSFRSVTYATIRIQKIHAKSKADKSDSGPATKNMTLACWGTLLPIHAPVMERSKDTMCLNSVRYT